MAGGFGTGKTKALTLELLKDIAIPQNYGVLGRKDLIELRSTTLQELFELLPSEVITSHNASERIITFQNGSTLFYTNLDVGRDAIQRISSLNLGFCAVDQLEEVDESVFLAIRGRLRRANTRRCFYATCNPAGHDWLYRTWKENEMLKQAGLSANDDYALFEAITTENIYLPPDYIRDLMSYPEQWKRRYVFCSWDNFEGLVYSEFDATRHLMDYFEPDPHREYIHFHIMDYGFQNPTAILFVAYDVEDRIAYIYDEYYQSGMLIPDIANDYKTNPYWKQAKRIADPSIYHTDKDGRSIFTDFLQYGVFWARGSNDKVRGFVRVNQLFKENRLKITKNCINFVREINDYKWKEQKPFTNRNLPEEAQAHNDHLMDALRYFANALYDGIVENDKQLLVRPHRGRFFASQQPYKKVF